MKADTASRTAQYMALFRALETRQRAGRRLFSDPLAIHFLDRGLQCVARLSVFPPVRRLAEQIIQRRIPGALASGVARTRYIDDLLKECIAGGCRQLIILGAGFDTRSLRLPFLAAVPVIEIDHPDTSGAKTAVIKKRLGALPVNTRYLQIDFNTQSLEELLVREQMDFSLPTVIVWEGVTNYLDAAAMDSMFLLLGRFAGGSAVIFTYVEKKVLNEPAAYYGGEKLLRDLNAIEERWTFGFDSRELPAYLEGFGFRPEADKGAADYRREYMPGRERLFRGYEFYRVALARKV
ncbi:MAG: SAM-dependent methyltransferase [Bacteroidetes bacterium]|nr:SAM-dependent methyltransferase [Bacteroidota bacterium]